MIFHTSSLTLFPYTTLFRPPYDGDDLARCVEARMPILSADIAAHDAVTVLGGTMADPPCAHDAEAAVIRHTRITARSEEHTSELQSPCNLVCRLLLEKKERK